MDSQRIVPDFGCFAQRLWGLAAAMGLGSGDKTNHLRHASRKDSEPKANYAGRFVQRIAKVVLITQARVFMMSYAIRG